MLIDAIIKDSYDSLIRPTSAFITFEEEDSRQVALKFDQESKMIHGQQIRFEVASEPTDIIWENRIYTKSDYFFRQVIAWTVISVILLASFAFIFVVRQNSL